jgi:hypothetical protein
MAADDATRRARVERLVEAARSLVHDAALRQRLLETTGLSAQNIELGLTRCLETEPVAEHLEDLLASVPKAPRAHVLLSGNVFVAALRAIAIGVASSECVQVRASRRDPALAEALHALTPELFQLVSELTPAPDDHFWSYGTDETLGKLRAQLPRGVWFHAHGAGFGAAVVEPRSFSTVDAQALALDTALFDQQGCLSPRVVCVQGDPTQARDVAEAVAHALSELEVKLPPGHRSPAELAELRRQRDAAAYAFELLGAGSGWVSMSDELVVPPALRSLHVTATPDPLAALRPFSSRLTNVASNDASQFWALRMEFEGARHVALGDMQRPALDGPVDRRHGTRGERL